MFAVFADCVWVALWTYRCQLVASRLRLASQAEETNRAKVGVGWRQELEVVGHLALRRIRATWSAVAQDVFDSAFGFRLRVSALGFQAGLRSKRALQEDYVVADCDRVRLTFTFSSAAGMVEMIKGFPAGVCGAPVDGPIGGGRRHIVWIGQDVRDRVHCG
ncbi:MAG TPA: hypothetical protein VFC00_36030 [Micromonosporaceae bacterium]|nr:hypothetical protein [Micromonosporaceae bacterium]